MQVKISSTVSNADKVDFVAVELSQSNQAAWIVAKISGIKKMPVVQFILFQVAVFKAKASGIS